MKIAFIVTMLLMSAVGFASAQTTQFYGPSGQYQGSAQRLGNTTTFYGSSGQYQGSTSTIGNTTSIYGPSGQYQGSTNTIGAPTRRP
jgi:hypothetical protein